MQGYMNINKYVLMHEMYIYSYIVHIKTRNHKIFFFLKNRKKMKKKILFI